MKDFISGRGERLTSWFLAAMIIVLLLGFGPRGYTDITFTKYLLFLLVTGLYLAAMAGVAVRSRFKEKKPLPSPAPLCRDAGLIRCCLLLFLAFSAVSAMRSPGVTTIIGLHRYEGLLTIALYIVTFLFVSVYGRPQKWLLFLFGAAVTIFCLICFAQFLGYNPFGLYPDGLTYYDANKAYRYQYLGTIGNVDLVAAFLSLAAPVLLLAIMRLRGKVKFLLLVPLAMVLAVTALSRVAAAYVAVFGGLFLLIPMAMLKKKRQKLLAWILILVLVLAGFALVFYHDFGTGTLHEFHQLLHGGWDDDYGSGRLFIWRNVLPLVAEKPLFGGGPDTLGQRMTVDFERYDANTGTLYRAAIDTAHNEYLNILVNEGALALGAYLAALIAFFVLFIRENHRNDVLAICGSGVFCYCIQAFFGIRICITAPFFWLCWALALAALSKRRVKSEE